MYIFIKYILLSPGDLSLAFVQKIGTTCIRALEQFYLMLPQCLTQAFHIYLQGAVQGTGKSPDCHSSTKVTLSQLRICLQEPASLCFPPRLFQEV